MLCSTIAITQVSTKRLISLDFARKQVYEVRAQGLEPSYRFEFKNDKYPRLNDRRHVSFSNKESFKNFVIEIDSLFNHFDVRGGEEISIKVQGKNINISRQLGVKAIYLFSDDGLGYTTLPANQIRRLMRFIDKM